MSERNLQSDVWRDDDEADDRFKRYSREEADAFRTRHPQLSPWRVIAAQAAMGAVTALGAWLVGGKLEFAWSALYGAAVAVVPGALMAHGVTSRLSSMTPGVSAASVMLWETVKIGFTVAMLVLAPRLLQPLVWPALLVALALCLSVYWFALLWRKGKN